VARESIYHFFETVVDEVIKLYDEADAPLEMIHTGGDEVPNGVWTRSPLCDSLLAKHPEIHEPKNLQAYFFRRINRILKERGLHCGGWEEVALLKNEKGNYSVNPEFANDQVVPYVWNNLFGAQDLAYRIANANYPVVLCPVSNFYFDLAYSNHPEEPGLYWGGFNDERDAWQFAPYNLFITTTHDGMERLIDTKTEYALMERLRPEVKKNILGLQAQLWHETIRGGSMMEYYLLPKLPAFAERCWTKDPEWETVRDTVLRQLLMDKEWAAFSEILYGYELPKLNYLQGGFNYRIPPAGAVVENGLLKANTASKALSIHYTTDGSEPDETSQVYTAPFPINGIVKMKVFDKAGKSSRVVEVMP
jgi:hexosaminidase